MVELKDEAELAVADVMAGAAAEGGQGAVAKEDIAYSAGAFARVGVGWIVGAVEGAGDVQEGGFARAAGAHDGDELAFGDFEIDAAEDLNAVGAHLVGFADVDQANEVTHSAPPGPDLPPRQ